ncbi:hypothetical protein CAP35_11525 [Chitinophagaceae bacterium IBVUCB1]|nr:hypothetical protein CAP35_11525 [Chitinophagaceae bacterium IBVUCB1]
MLFTYELLPKAEEEYINAYLWYEEQQQGLGEKFAKAVRGKLDKITSNPKLYYIRKGVFREAVLDNFPFIIVFIIEESNIIIASIFHTKRNPSKKYR